MSEHAATVSQLGEAVAAGRNGPNRAALALALHHYYTALETALSRTIRAIEGSLPSGPDWHVTLLDHAAQPLDPLRPALVSPDRLPELAELRRFRHFLRNAYPVELEPERLSRLTSQLEATHPGLERDLTELIAFLEAIRDRVAE